jgi:hypothetical protein
VFIAQVRFFGPDKGGRSIPPQPGYHPQVDAGDEYTSCAIERLGEETVFEFDKTYVVRLRLLFPDFYRGRFSVGKVVHFYEGHHLVGSGTILSFS